jgi:hypothetical protein
MFGPMMSRVEWLARRKGKVEIHRVISCCSCSSAPYLTYSIWYFPSFLCIRRHSTWTLKAQEELRSVLKQYSVLEVQRRREDD